MAPLLLTLCAGTALLFSPARASVPAPRPQLRVAAPQLAANGGVAAVTKVSTPTLSVAIFKNLIGAGVFLIPAGVVRVGLAPALLALVIAGVISAATFYAFGRAASQTGTRTTSDMWSATVGPKSAWAYDSVLFLMCFGGLIQYTVTIVNLLQQVPAPAALAVLSQRTPAVLAVSATLLPLALCRDLHAFRHASLVGVYAAISSVGFVVLRALDGTYRAGGRFFTPAVAAAAPAPWGFTKMSLLLPYLASLNSAFTAHTNVPRYYDELRSGKLRDFGAAAVLAFGACIVLYAAVVVGGALTFGRNLADGRMLLAHYHPADRGALAMRLATALSVAGGYPHLFLAARDLCASGLASVGERFGESRAGRALTALGASHRALTLAVSAATLVGVLAAKNLEAIFVLRGALFTSWISFGFAGLVLRASSPKGGAGARGGAILVAYAAVSSVVSSYLSLRN